MTGEIIVILGIIFCCFTAWLLYKARRKHKEAIRRRMYSCRSFDFFAASARNHKEANHQHRYAELAKIRIENEHQLLKELEHRKKELERKLTIVHEQSCQIKNKITRIIELQFMVQPCFRCHERSMRLLEISPNGRSVHYQCLHCKKKMHSPAGTAEAANICELWSAMVDSLSEYEGQRREILQLWIELIESSGESIGLSDDHFVSPEGKVLTPKEHEAEARAAAFPPSRTLKELVFEAPTAPLPFEQTSRTPIPEAIRSEVWRRDGGQCVQCGSRQKLQFDHIIPVTRGGATTVVNLQLLCQPCNGSKSNKI